MDNINGGKILIKDLFAKANFYRVPYYQRPYSWDEENFKDLINDLLDANKNQEYFIGTIVLHTKSDGISDIVDGQQRLTTLMILLACIRDLITDVSFKKNIQEKIKQDSNVVDGIPEKLRLEVKDGDVFNRVVANENGTLTTPTGNIPEPEIRFYSAVRIFREKIGSLPQLSLQELSQFISQKCILISLSTNSFDDAFKLFTIVNDRGKQLRRIDILKAINIAPTTVPSETKRNSLAQKWEEWEKNLGEDTFENVFYLVRFILLGEKLSGDLLSEYEDKIFAKGIIAKGETFVDEICKYCSLYNELFEDYTFFKDHAKANSIISLMYAMNNEFQSYEWRAVIMSYIKKYDKEGIEKFLNLLEIKYLEGWINSIGKDGRVAAFSPIIKVINSSKKSSEVLKSSVLVADTDSMLTKLSNDIYGASYCKYILLRLELLVSEFANERKYKVKSIEHVLPQTPADGSDWKSWFSDDELKSWTNKLANLVLLSKSKNSAARNYDFDKKKTTYLKDKVSEFPRSIQVIACTEWKPKDLEKRQEDLKKIVLNPILVE